MREETRKGRIFWIFVLALLFLIPICSLIALCLGPFRIAPLRVIEEFLSSQKAGSAQDNVRRVLFYIRLPRIRMSLGVANGASFGAAGGILLGLGGMGVEISALCMGLFAVLLVFTLSKRMSTGSPSILQVILTGMVISSLFSALVSLVKYAADPQDVLPVITFWLMGSFSGVTVQSLIFGAPFILCGTLLLFLLRFRLNALSLPEDEARSLGIPLQTTRMLVILGSTMSTAAVVALCGLIGWVGLLIPHIARMIFGNDNRRVIPASILLGALFMLLVDTIARCMTAAEIPVSILTATIGAPVFILLLQKTGGLNG